MLARWYDFRDLGNGVARLVQAVGAAGRRLQTGVVHHYLLWVVAAVALFFVSFH